MLGMILEIFKEQKADFGSMTPKNLSIMEAPLIGTNNILNKDSSLTTTIAISGSYNMMGEETFEEFGSYLMQNLMGPLKAPGRILHVSYNKDNTLTKNKLRESVASGWKKTKYGFNVGPLLQQQEDVMSERVSYEQAYLSITTTVDVLPKVTAKKAKKNARQAFLRASKEYLKGSQANYSQIPKVFVKDITKIHDSFVSNIFNVLKEYLDVKILSPKDVIKELRTFYFPEAVTPNYEAKIYGNHAQLTIGDNKEFVSQRENNLIIQTDKKGSGNDISNLLYPGLDEQIILSDAEVDDEDCKKAGVRGVVRIGKRYYAPIVISSPPEQHTRFDTLFNSIDFRIPFRMMMSCETGLDKFVAKLGRIKGSATMLAITNSDNKRIKEASEHLIESYKSGADLPLNTHTLFLTWGRTPEETDRNRDNIISSLQSWGGPDSTPEYGDPYISAMEAMPGFSRRKTAPGFVQRLSEVIQTLPYTRPSSPWKNGSLMFYTKENKIWHYSLGSSVQQTWIELISAGPGSGKSLWMAGSNISLLLNTPNDSLPKIGIIDVGSSSKYMIDLMKALAPDHLKNEFASYRIKMSDEYAFNPFDTLLGCRYPLSVDRDFLINFLTLVLTPIDIKESPEGLTELVTELVKQVYIVFDPDVNPESSRKYTVHEIPELDKVLETYDLNYTEDSPLFEVVDKLMELEEYEIAKKAQSFAVPRLSDLQSVLNQSQIIRDQYQDEKGANLVQMCTRQLNYASNAYPILRRPSVFDVGSASIVSLDLGEIVQSGSESPQSIRMAGIAYLLARYMVGKNYYRHEDNLQEQAVPEKYREYHKYWIEKEATRIKRLCMDEFHATSRTPSIQSQVEMDMRTGRKHNVIVTLASQKDKDFNDTMRSLSTTTLIMGKANQSVRKKQQEEYGLNKDTMDSLINYVSAPNDKGSSMIIFGMSKKSSFSQMVYYLPPPIIIWGLSTTTEDVLLRNYVTEREGDYLNALAKLSQVFRQGTAKPMFESYKINGNIEIPKNSTMEREIAKILYETEISKVQIKEQDFNVDNI